MIPIYKVWEAITEKLPTALQESYDNCGLQVGDPSQPATGVLCCVDITEAVLYEAIAKSCNVIVAHHPLLFKGLKQVGTSSSVSAWPYVTILPFMQPTLMLIMPMVG